MNDQVNLAEPWTVNKSAELYQVSGWGAPYFTVNEHGRVEVRPHAESKTGVDLYDLVVSLRERGVGLPILLRFADILGDRIRELNECFAEAIREYEYGGSYRGVYPVKVNQHRHLVEAVVELGRPWRYGLEAGSKAELLIALSVMQEDDGFIVCNGYKDLGYIETALVAQQFDNTVIIVLERIEELDLALRASARLGVRPRLGVRAKLSAKGVGRWSSSAGDRAKFGLTKSEIVEVVDLLKEREMLDCLRLLHFHIGSQVSSIMPIKTAVREASHIYAELAKMGCRMGYLDVGGGLAIDYDGSKTDFHASRNYTGQEYAHDVVSEIQSVCAKASVPEPTIVTESGRAIAAHQSVLVFDVVGANEVRFGEPAPLEEGAHRVLEELYETYENILPKNVQESWHDAGHAKEEAQSLFKYGYFSLRELAQAERLYWNCCEKIQDTLSRVKRVPEELEELQKDMAAIYYGNFSIFQSAPDTWAMDHLFPIMPIHRLDERPTVHATVADLTCDSDGIIDHFIDLEDEAHTLPVHALNGELYIMGLFLCGAYQEILGDMHNLFGDTNAVHIILTENGYQIAHVVKGDSMADVLRYVTYTPDDMVESVRRQAERAVQQERITVQQMRLLLDHFEQALGRYTYLAAPNQDNA